jgi:hypothetical protein
MRGRNISYFDMCQQERASMQRGMNFKPNADGSVMLYIRNQSPGAKEERNWLPAPKDKFILMMRLYWPKETSPTILNDSWSIPEAKKVS